MYSRTPFIRIKWEDKQSECAENPDKWIFFEQRLNWRFQVRLLIYTVRT